MRPHRLVQLGSPLVIAATLAFAGSAHAAAPVTIGSTALPSGASMPTSACTTGKTTELVPYATGSSNIYAVPAGGGSITSWSFNTTGAKAGTPYTLLVERPNGTNYQIVATDPETVPANAPAVQTFQLAQAIPVQAGDLVGAMVNEKSAIGCLFKGGSIPSTDQEGYAQTPGAVGSSFGLIRTIGDEMVNVSATVVQSNDISVSQTAEPSTIMQGDDGVFVLNVASTGPSQTGVTVTDTLPSGLTPVSASAGTGTCATSGQKITCQVAAAPASIAVVAAATATGSYVNTATASGPLLDPDLSNNTATATLGVDALPSVPSSSSDTGGFADLADPLVSLDPTSAGPSVSPFV